MMMEHCIAATYINITRWDNQHKISFSQLTTSSTDIYLWNNGTYSSTPFKLTLPTYLLPESLCFPSATTSQLVLTNQVNSTHHLNNCIHFQSLPLSFPSSPSIIYCKYYLTIFLVADPLGWWINNDTTRLTTSVNSFVTMYDTLLQKREERGK